LGVQIVTNRVEKNKGKCLKKFIIAQQFGKEQETKVPFLSIDFVVLLIRKHYFSLQTILDNFLDLLS